MKFNLILVCLLTSLTSYGSEHFWRYSQKPGSEYYWLYGDKVGSEYYWKHGKDKGSEYYWKYSQGEGSEYYWKHKKGPGTEYFWKYDKGPGSEHYWKFGQGPGSEYYWRYEKKMAFDPEFIALCVGGAIKIAPCELMTVTLLQGVSSLPTNSFGHAPLFKVPSFINKGGRSINNKSDLYQLPAKDQEQSKETSSQ